MGKADRARTAVKIMERVIALPGTWDDLRIWLRVLLTIVFPGLTLISRRVREWIVASAPWDTMLLAAGILCIPISAYIVLAVGFSRYRRQNPSVFIPMKTALSLIGEAINDLRTHQNRLENIRADMRRDKADADAALMRAQEEFVKKYTIRFVDDDQELPPGGRPLTLGDVDRMLDDD